MKNRIQWNTSLQNLVPKMLQSLWRLKQIGREGWKVICNKMGVDQIENYQSMSFPPILSASFIKDKLREFRIQESSFLWILGQYLRLAGDGKFSL